MFHQSSVHRLKPRGGLQALASRRSRGVALVIVLGFLVLISALMVAFFTSVQTELSSSKSYSASATVKQLSETATNIVMSQISDGTKSFQIPSNFATGVAGSGKRLTWASQPGAIHTFGDDGKPVNTFKLYSALNMVVGATEYIPSQNLNSEVPATWPTQPAMYTDLNAPTLVPDAAGTIKGVDGKTYNASYPILDPTSLTANPSAVPEGFSIDTTIPGYQASARPTDKPSANPAPMPVAWLYVLQNGTITSPAGVSADGLTANWSNLGSTSPNKPSKDNPIVGRIAFWTDDECSKLNVNTASEPTPWDTPRCFNKFDLDYGRYQPANQEFQRYPGHPAGVALSSVFFPNQTLTPAQKGSIYDMVPRVTNGGTMSATVMCTSAVQSPIDTDRLFANMDEFLFRPDRSLNATVGPSVLRSSRFFLTANSTAPELNAFGLPRVSLWPITQQPNGASQQTGFDKLSMFCSTIASPSGISVGGSPLGYPFFFQRYDPVSPVNDYVNLPRNQTLYTYLQTLTGMSVPGFGGNLGNSWGTGATGDRDQILTEIFDYIRCVNLHDTQAGATSYTNASFSAAGTGQVAPIQISTNGNMTKGFGRMHTMSQFGIQFICSQDGQNGLTTSTSSDSSQTMLPAGTRAIEAAILMEPFSPSLGYYKLYENMSVRVTFNAPVTVNGKDLQFPTSPTVGNITGQIEDGFHKNGRERGGSGGLRGTAEAFYSGGKYIFSSTAAPRVTVDASKPNPTMNVSNVSLKVEIFSAPNASGAALQTFNVTIPGGDFPIPQLITAGPSVARGSSAQPATWWYKFSTRFSAMNSTPYLPSSSEYPNNPERTWQNDNSGYPPGFKTGSVIHKLDVVRSVVPKHGDIRLIAAQTTVNANTGGDFEGVYKTVADWTDPTKPLLHVFEDSSGSHFQYGNANEPGFTSLANDQLIPVGSVTPSATAVTYHYSRLPEIKQGAGATYNQWGDFDNGCACWVDGAYINKPDEGSVDSTGLGSIPYFSWNYSQNPPATLFSPNRLMPSAGMLGSLPTGVNRKQPWQTLLFRPQAVQQYTGAATPHPGSGTPAAVPSGKAGPPYNGAYTKPPDFLVMDLFWMPVIEPYAISEAFSTAGRINMNYEIAPFTYIHRKTGLYAAMKGEAPMVIPNSASKYYKLWDHEVHDNGSDNVSVYMPDGSGDNDPDTRNKWAMLKTGQAPFDKIRWPLDPGQTLQQFDSQFTNNGVFRSATQICQMHLVRQGENLSDYQNNSYWQNALVTGDNTRERPYTNLYAKLTTKSNTFTVHMRVQVLRKKPSTDPSTWVEGQDRVVGEYRGSTLLERYIDASAKLPDFASAANSSAGSLDDYYKFRIISTKKFVP